MKKRILCMTLVLTVFAGSLFSCQEPEENKAPGITLASSDAQPYADWLTDRLTNISESVVIGIGNSDEYGVDMTDFEDDGYLIKKQNNDLVIIGKTADGLDRGVRKYANAIDAGESVEDVTYHKGVRIEELKLFGTDISEFVINHPEDSNANMEFAATELQMLVKKATGVELPIKVGSTDAAKKIELRHTDDEALEEDGYRYFEESGNLVIEGAVARGCLNGVYRFLQNELGWDALIYGDSYLNEADLIDVPAGLNKSEVPIMEYLNIHGNFWEPNAYVTDRTDIARGDERNSYGPVSGAGHGLHNWHPLVPSGTGGKLVCFSDEYVYEIILGNILEYIEDHEKAGGKAGVTLKEIDISQGDTNNYCLCTTCVRIARTEEKSFAGPILRFANRLAEELNEKYDNIAVHIFAYMAAKKPPEKTKAHDMVYVTYCQSGGCLNHSMRGEECKEVDYGNNIKTLFEFGTNKLNDEFLSGWCDIAKNVNVWNYVLDSVLQQYTVLDILLENFQYMDELDIRGMFWQNTYHGFGIKRIEQQLGYEINWNKDMTEEEYEAELCALLEREYGPGWEYIREYIDLWIEATDRAGCLNTSVFGSSRTAKYDWVFMKDNCEKMIELVEKAITMAGSEKQEYRCKLLSCSVDYCAIFSQYFTAYEAEDEATMTKLNEQYQFVYDRIVELGFTPETIASVDGGTTKMYPTLEEEAWNVWVDEREIQVGTEDLRPAPDWYIEQQAATGDA